MPFTYVVNVYSDMLLSKGHLLTNEMFLFFSETLNVQSSDMPRFLGIGGYNLRKLRAETGN